MEAQGLSGSQWSRVVTGETTFWAFENAMVYHGTLGFHFQSFQSLGQSGSCGWPENWPILDGPHAKSGT